MKAAQRVGVWVGIVVGLSSVACQDVRQPVAPIGAYSVGYETCETIDAAGGSVSAGPYSLTIPAYARYLVDGTASTATGPVRTLVGAAA